MENIVGNRTQPRNEPETEPTTEATKAKMNEVFKVQMDKLDRRAREIITDNRALFNAIVDALMEKKMLSRKELFDLKGEYEHV
jgi:ATP-dependent Zn protease